MDTKELLKKVRKIEIKTRGISNELFSGEYHSAFKGRGMSFSEVRDYHYGDDVRNIEWNVTARTGTPHIKVFEEERELTVMLMVDVSPSSRFGTRHQLRAELITELSAVLAFSAMNNSDKVGLILFSDQIDLFIPPKKGRKHILRIIRELIEHRAEGKQTDIEQGLEYFNNVVKKRSICFLMTDFIAPPFERALQVAARKHDLIGLHMVDPFERELPKAGLIRIGDIEAGGEHWLDTSSETIRAEHRNRFAQRSENLTALFRKNGADLIAVETGASYITALRQFFKKRAR
ncbi:MAG: DUF58 domain-containing protein [Saprospiraceae bacterium]|nr:DUF58 domain-containing protein [Saprospiraceae bacterium]